MVQAPENILTVLRALKLPSGPHANAVFNALLDHGHVEKLALVEVPPAPLRLHAAPAALVNCALWATQLCARQRRQPCLTFGSSHFRYSASPVCLVNSPGGLA